MSKTQLVGSCLFEIVKVYHRKRKYLIARKLKFKRKIDSRVFFSWLHRLMSTSGTDGQLIPRITLIVTAFVIARQFKAQSTYFLSNTKIFTNFVGGRETSLVQVALVSFISIVTYIIYG